MAVESDNSHGVGISSYNVEKEETITGERGYLRRTDGSPATGNLHHCASPSSADQISVKVRIGLRPGYPHPAWERPSLKQVNETGATLVVLGHPAELRMERNNKAVVEPLDCATRGENIDNALLRRAARHAITELTEHAKIPNITRGVYASVHPSKRIPSVVLYRETKTILRLCLRGRRNHRDQGKACGEHVTSLSELRVAVRGESPRGRWARVAAGDAPFIGGTDERWHGA